MQNMDEIFNDAALQKRERVKVGTPDVFSDYWRKTIIIINETLSLYNEMKLQRTLMMFPEVENCSKAMSFHSVSYDMPTKMLSSMVEYLDDRKLKTIISFNGHFNFDWTVHTLIDKIAQIYTFNTTIIFVNHKTNIRETLYPIPLMRILLMGKIYTNNVDIRQREYLKTITDPVYLMKMTVRNKGVDNEYLNKLKQITDVLK